MGRKRDLLCIFEKIFLKANMFLFVVCKHLVCWWFVNFDVHKWQDLHSRRCGGNSQVLQCNSGLSFQMIKSFNYQRVAGQVGAFHLQPVNGDGLVG